jgi:hypothetical protein
MTKSKNRRKRKPFRKPAQDPCAERLGHVAQEVALAGGTVLAEHFGFSPDQIDEWMGLTVKQAQQIRAKMAVKKALEIEAEKRGFDIERGA